MYAEVAKFYGKNKSSICDIVKKEKEIRVSFAVALQTTKVTSTMGNKCLVKIKKALSLHNKTFREKEETLTFI